MYTKKNFKTQQAEFWNKFYNIPTITELTSENNAVFV